MICRICGDKTIKVLDLGDTALANELLDAKGDDYEEYPLCLCFCESCKNLQLDHFVDPGTLYKNYFYSTPNSEILNLHYQFLMNFMCDSAYLNDASKVVEVGSNAGQFLEVLSNKVSMAIGVEPAANIVAKIHNEQLKVVNNFFTVEVAQQLKRDNGLFDLVLARHCFAHNPNPAEMIRSASELLSDNGLMIIENAYAINTLMNGEFDQIYHEHMYYYSLTSIAALYKSYGFELIDATVGDVHGGSIVAVLARQGKRSKSKALQAMFEIEKLALDTQSVLEFASRSEKNKANLAELIRFLSDAGNTIYSYGATAKGNTLLNSMGINSSKIKFCIDNTPIKIGKYLPGSEILIQSEEFGSDNPPDYYFLTAWNYKSEIIKKVRKTGNYKTRFIVPFPNVHIV